MYCTEDSLGIAATNRIIKSIKMNKQYRNQFGCSSLKTALHVTVTVRARLWSQQGTDYPSMLMNDYNYSWCTFFLSGLSCNLPPLTPMFCSQLGLLRISHSLKAHPLTISQGKITSPSYPKKTTSLTLIRTYISPQMSTQPPACFTSTLSSVPSTCEDHFLCHHHLHPTFPA